MPTDDVMPMSDERLLAIRAMLGRVKSIVHRDGYWLDQVLAENELQSSITVDDCLSAIARLDTETAARVAAEARCRVLEEALGDEVRAAFIDGCEAVHKSYQDDSDPDFYEAASDYVASRAALTSQD